MSEVPLYFAAAVLERARLLDLAKSGQHVAPYRGTPLRRKHHPLGPYSRILSRALW